MIKQQPKKIIPDAANIPHINDSVKIDKKPSDEIKITDINPSHLWDRLERKIQNREDDEPPITGINLIILEIG